MCVTRAVIESFLPSSSLSDLYNEVMMDMQSYKYNFYKPNPPLSAAHSYTVCCISTHSCTFNAVLTGCQGHRDHYQHRQGREREREREREKEEERVLCVVDMKRNIGSEKQMFIFLLKASKNNGNLDQKSI